MASMAEVGVEVKSSPDKFWTAIHASTKLIPRIFPPHHKSIRIIEGDGNSISTIRLLKYAQGEDISPFTYLNPSSFLWRSIGGRSEEIHQLLTCMPF